MLPVTLREFGTYFYWNNFGVGPKGSLGFFFHPPTPLKIKEGTWNMEQSRSPPTADLGRQTARRAANRRPSRQPVGGCCQPSQRPHATAQRPAANGQRPSGRGALKQRGSEKPTAAQEQDTRASLSAITYLCGWPPSTTALPPFPSLHAPPEWRHSKCPSPS